MHKDTFAKQDQIPIIHSLYHIVSHELSRVWNHQHIHTRILNIISKITTELDHYSKTERGSQQVD